MFRVFDYILENVKKNFQSLKFANEINKTTLNSMKKIQNDNLMSFLIYLVVYGLFTKHARLLTLLCQEPVDPCIFLYLQKASIKYRTNYTVLPRTSFYCTTFSPNSIIPVQIFTLRWLFSTSPYICRFHCDYPRL